MKISQTKAKEIAKNKMLSDLRIKNVLEKYSDYIVSFPSQTSRENITMYRTWITLFKSVQDEEFQDDNCEKQKNEDENKEEIIAFCEVSFETGESTDVKFVYEYNNDIKVSIEKAEKIAQNKLLQNSQIKKVIEKYNNRYSIGSQILAENLLVYRAYLSVAYYINNNKKKDMINDNINDYIAYCDVYLETGESSEIIFTDIFKEL